MDYDVVAQGAEAARQMTVRIRADGNAPGLEALIRGDADIWMTSRPPRQSDMDLMASHNVPNIPTLSKLLASSSEHLIGLAALAIVVNPHNPVPVLTAAQARDVFAGKSADWDALAGSPKTPVARYMLDTGFDESDIFCGAIMGTADPRACLQAMPGLAAAPFGQGEDLADAVAGNPSAIGIVGFSAHRGARPVPFATACGSGIKPSAFRIKAEEYPLTTRLYLVTAPDRPLSPTVSDFLAFATGPIGQAAIASTGLPDLAPDISDAGYGPERLYAVTDAMDNRRTVIPPETVAAFTAAIKGADRLSVTFRFPAGSTTPDKDTDANITRLASFLRQPGHQFDDIALVGYGSTINDGDDPYPLSRRRADAIRDLLLIAGVTHVHSVGVGPAAAVACNLDPVTAALNQRVEIWVRRR
jgi:phosphate transport system substrate-binding protein